MMEVMERTEMITGELSQLIGEVLRELRLEKNLKLRQLSSASGVALGYLSEVERAVKDISSKMLTKILIALDISLYEFLILVAEKEKNKTL
jgi:transcriptional regulator with XRE-family HTH domain